MNYQVESILLPKERNVCLAKGYKVSDQFLGGGAVGRVFLAEVTKQLIETNDTLKLLAGQDGQLKVAMKIVYADLGTVGVANLAKYLPTEISNLNKTFGHPNIIKLLDVFVSCKRIFMAMEYAAKGDLKALYRRHVTNNPEKTFFEENLARQYFMKILRGVQHLHKNNIAHRDLKLENILVTEDGEVKLGDLGFSVGPTTNQEHNDGRVFGKFPCRVSVSQCGTPGFMAPEVLRSTKGSRMSSGYNAVQADLWSLGVVLFVLVNGQYPFPGKTPKEVLKQYEKVKSASLPFRRGLSIECQDLINRLISYNPRSRPKVFEIMRDPWITQDPKKHQGIPYREIMNPLLPSMEACRISNHQKISFQATYVCNYLIQRKEFLKEARKCISKSGKTKPEDLQNAGIRIRLPRRDTQGKSVDEVWRFEAYQDRSASKVPNPFVANTSENPKDPWVLPPESMEPTLGIFSVRRELARAPPLLKKWREIRRCNKTPETYMEKCVQLCNTVDLDRTWPPAEPPPKPPTQQWVEVLDVESRYPGNHSRISERGNLMILKRVPEQKFSARDVLVTYTPKASESSAYRRRYFKTAGEIFKSQTSSTHFTFYLSPKSVVETDGRIKSKIPTHSSRKKLNKLRKLKRRKGMRGSNRSACDFHSPREVKPNPREIVPIDLARVLHRDDRGFTRIPAPKQTPLHKLYPPRSPSTSKSESLQNLANAQAATRKSIIAEHSSRKVANDMGRRTLPSYAFSKFTGVDPKEPPQKSVLKLLDVRQFLQRNRDSRTKIPMPNFVEKTRQKIRDLYLSKKLQKDEATQNPGRLKRVSTKILKKKDMVNWCKAQIFPTLFSYKSEVERTKPAKPDKTTINTKPVQFILNWKRCPNPEDREKREQDQEPLLPVLQHRNQQVSGGNQSQNLQNIRYKPHIRRGKGTKATYRPQLHSSQRKNQPFHDITRSSDRTSLITEKQSRSGHRDKNSHGRNYRAIPVRTSKEITVSSDVAKRENMAHATKKVSLAEGVLTNDKLSTNRGTSRKKVNKTANSNVLCQTSSRSVNSVGVSEMGKQQAGQNFLLVEKNEKQSYSISEKVARLEKMSWKSLLDSDIFETDLGASWSGPDADKLQVVKEWMGEDDFMFFRRSAFENYVDNLSELSDDESDSSVCSNETVISVKVATKDSESFVQSSCFNQTPATTVTSHVDRIVNEMLEEESPLLILNKLPELNIQDTRSAKNCLDSRYSEHSEHFISPPDQKQVKIENSEIGNYLTGASGETTPLLCDSEVLQFPDGNFEEVKEMFGYHSISDEYLVRTELPKVTTKDTELDSNASDNLVELIPYVQLSSTASASHPSFSPMLCDAPVDVQATTTVNNAIDINDKPISQSLVIEEYLPLIKSWDSKQGISLSPSLTNNNDMSISELAVTGPNASNTQLGQIVLPVSDKRLRNSSMSATDAQMTSVTAFDAQLSKISVSASDRQLGELNSHKSDAQLSCKIVSHANSGSSSMSSSDVQLSEIVLRVSDSQLSKTSTSVSEARLHVDIRGTPVPDELVNERVLPLSDVQLSERSMPNTDSLCDEKRFAVSEAQLSERVLPGWNAQLSGRGVPRAEQSRISASEAQLSIRATPEPNKLFSERVLPVSKAQLSEIIAPVLDAKRREIRDCVSDAPLSERVFPVLDAQPSEIHLPISNIKRSQRVISESDMELSDERIPAWDEQLSESNVSLPHSQLSDLSIHISGAKLSKKSMPKSDVKQSEKTLVSDSFELKGSMTKSPKYLPKTNVPISNSHVSQKPTSSIKLSNSTSLVPSTAKYPSCNQAESVGSKEQVQTSKLSTFTHLKCALEEAVMPVVLPEPLYESPSLPMAPKAAKVAKVVDLHQKDIIKQKVKTVRVKNRLPKKDESLSIIYTNKKSNDREKVEKPDRKTNVPATSVQDQQRRCANFSSSNSDNDMEIQFADSQSSHSSRQFDKLGVTGEFPKTEFLNVTPDDTVSTPGEKSSAKAKYVSIRIKVPFNADNKSRLREICDHLTDQLSKQNDAHGKKEKLNEKRKETVDVKRRQCESAPSHHCRDVASQFCASEGMQSQTRFTDGKSTQTVSRESKSIQKDGGETRSTQVLEFKSKATQKCLSVSKSTQAVETRSMSTQTDSITEFCVRASKRSRRRNVCRKTGNEVPLSCYATPTKQNAAPLHGSNSIFSDDCNSLSSFDPSPLCNVETPCTISNRQNTVQIIQNSFSVLIPTTTQTPMTNIASRPNRSHPYANRLTRPQRDSLPTSLVAASHLQHHNADHSHRRTPSESDYNVFVPLGGVDAQRPSDLEGELNELNQNKGDMCTPPQSTSPPRESFAETRAFVSRMQRMQRHVAQNYINGSTSRNRSPSHGYSSYRERMQRLDPNNSMGSSLFPWEESDKTNDVERGLTSFSSNQGNSR